MFASEILALVFMHLKTQMNCQTCAAGRFLLHRWLHNTFDFIQAQQATDMIVFTYIGDILMLKCKCFRKIKRFLFKKETVLIFNFQSLKLQLTIQVICMKWSSPADGIVQISIFSQKNPNIFKPFCPCWLHSEGDCVLCLEAPEQLLRGLCGAIAFSLKTKQVELYPMCFLREVRTWSWL